MARLRQPGCARVAALRRSFVRSGLCEVVRSACRRQHAEIFPQAGRVGEAWLDRAVAYPIAAGYFILLTLCLIWLFGVVNQRLNRHLPGQARRLRYRPNIIR